MNTLRWNPLGREWVAFASHRQVRPIALAKTAAAGSCPFCPGGAEGLNAPYEIVAFENKFPSFDPHAAGPAVADGGWRRTRPGKGVCEVVLYSSRHDATLADLPARDLGRLVEVWRDRYLELGARPGIKYIYVFENKGAVIGVTLSHPHGQIYAFPFIPPKVATELAAERAYRRRHRRCLICDVARRELKDRERLVAVNATFVAYVPYFARYPYEVHIASRRHLGHLGELRPGERADLAAVLRAVIVAYDRLFGFSFPYIMLMHQTPTDGRRHPHHHFHVEFYPPHRSADKIKYLAGCEAGAGTFINDTLPEEKAAELRRAARRG